jgi:hypothetical protein
MQMELLLVTISDFIMLVHELIFFRNYRSKDSLALKLLIAFLVYVGDTEHLSLCLNAVVTPAVWTPSTQFYASICSTGETAALQRFFISSLYQVPDPELRQRR